MMQEGSPKLLAYQPAGYETNRMKLVFFVILHVRGLVYIYHVKD
jgi:hypothetical protein